MHPLHVIAASPSLVTVYLTVVSVCFTVVSVRVTVVIPAKAGIHLDVALASTSGAARSKGKMDPGFRRDDGAVADACIT
ncbi:hypothetical protein FQY83_15270 [Luteimonas marina]|uniref:Uncharacterized protein n=1 Tax=Luteimonas marina TaxID=488485 RepID=A0A5C5TWE8_9GAMM|nr:hypothetical protein [Luteimonas marina]TWT18104.1 hypothetical protein FQY83_15270 [Luteimonas marina]